MKHLYIFTFILLFAYQYARAQQGFHVGVNASAVNSYLFDTKLYGDVDYRSKFTYGPLIGIAAGNNFTDQFGLEMEVNYARLGQTYEYDDTLGLAPNFSQQSGKITLDYFQVPVLLKLTGGDFKTRFSAMAGPQFSFLANAWNRKTENGESVQANDAFNKTDVGLLVTAGSDISLTKDNDLYLNIGLRMYYGFMQANAERVIPPSPFPGSRQVNDYLHNAYGGINIGVHYLFRNNKALDKTE